MKISPEAIDPDDPELLADMIVAAVNEAIRSAQSLAETQARRRHGRHGGPEGARPARPLATAPRRRRRVGARVRSPAARRCAASLDPARSRSRARLHPRAAGGRRSRPAQPVDAAAASRELQPVECERVTRVVVAQQHPLVAAVPDGGDLDRRGDRSASRPRSRALAPKRLRTVTSTRSDLPTSASATR